MVAVKGGDFVFGCAELRDERVADESGAANDQDEHRFFSSRGLKPRIYIRDSARL